MARAGSTLYHLPEVSYGQGWKCPISPAVAPTQLRGRVGNGTLSRAYEEGGTGL